MYRDIKECMRLCVGWQYGTGKIAEDSIDDMFCFVFSGG